MSSKTERIAHKRAVRAAFDRAAAHYDAAAGVQREICDALACALSPDGNTTCVLDAGCGTGYAIPHLKQRHPRAEIIALDFAPSMLSRLGAGSTAVCGDIERLPFADASFGLIWSSLALQWCDPRVTLGEFTRTLRPGGSLWIATLGPRTLIELRDAFRAVDDAPHVLDFHPLESWLAAAHAYGLESAYQHTFATAVRAPDLRGIVRHIKGIGAHRVGPGARPALTRAQWRALEQRYERYRDAEGLLTACYDVILLGFRRSAR